MSYICALGFPSLVFVPLFFLAQSGCSTENNKEPNVFLQIRLLFSLVFETLKGLYERLWNTTLIFFFFEMENIVCLFEIEAT